MSWWEEGEGGACSVTESGEWFQGLELGRKEENPAVEYGVWDQPPPKNKAKYMKMVDRKTSPAELQSTNTSVCPSGCFGRGWIQTGANRSTLWEETKSLGSFVRAYGRIGLFTVNSEACMQGRRGKDCFETRADGWKALIRKPDNLTVLILSKISKILTRAVRWVRKMLYYL